jgi:hypothetical protein
VCAFQIEEYNNFYKSKMNYKVSYMLMHLCFCILFLKGVDLIQTQRFKNQLENEFGNCFGKKKSKILFFILPPSLSAC